MKKVNASSHTDRRQFLQAVWPAGAMCCLVSTSLPSSTQKIVNKPKDEIDAEMHKSFYIGAEHSAASIIYFAFKKLIDNYGDKGRIQAEEITWEWGKYYGIIIREEVEKAGLENTPDNYWVEPNPVALYWKPEGGGFVKRTSKEIIKEFTYCPLNEGFKQLGPEAEKIGDIYCDLVDKAVWKYYNPEWKVEREKSFRKHGVCRLTWRKI
jgi:hypothetical protein